jgi:hypothetical protein
MKIQRIITIVAILVVALPAAAKKDPPAGILAASVGDQVVLADPVSGRSVEFASGPVGWLYPAPGGILFAPDVVNNTTTVINLRSLAVVERMDGLTMPHFGETPDRYVALAREVLMVSYPERAVMARIPAEVAHPWQVITSPDDAAMLILERLPDAATGVHMTTVNLITRQVVYRRPLAGDVVHMSLSPYLGLLALADRSSDRVRLVQPATLMPMADHPTRGRPVDVGFTAGGKTLATAVASGDGAGVLDLALFKRNKKGLKLQKVHLVDLPSTPVRLAVAPGDDKVAVALDTGEVAIVHVDDREIVATVALPAAPRDLRWCDFTRPGPMVPEWSDDEPADLDFGPFETPIKSDTMSGLDDPQ